MIKKTCLFVTFSFALLFGDTIKEKQIVAVIPSYNNGKWAEKNLTSVLNQNYRNFRVVYIDDCSIDSTLLQVNEILAKYEDPRVLILHNDTRKGALFNIYHAVHLCNDDEIVVLIDGDDWLAHENVFNIINQSYSQEKPVWLTHGSYVTSKGVPGISCPASRSTIRKNTFREFFQPSHLRTFYAWLFKKIRKEDLLYEGDFFTMTGDLAIMYPMIEMAGRNHAFIPETVYIYNDENPINDHRKDRVLQLELFEYIKKMNKYMPL